MSGPFVTLEGRAELIREKAVHFSLPLELPNWIPRSRLHPEDAARLDSEMNGAVVRLRIEKAKADELGLTAKRDTKTNDLFGGTTP